MAATIVREQGASGMAESFLTLVSLDQQPHTFSVMLPPDQTLTPIVWTFRGWWTSEEITHAEQLQLALRTEQATLRQLDHQRWIVIGAIAPALWPVAAGYGSVLAHPQSAELGMQPYELPFELYYNPVPETEQADEALTLAEDPTRPGHWQVTLRPSPLATPLSGLGLRVQHPADAVPSLLMTSHDGTELATPMPLPVRFQRIYGASGEHQEHRWHQSGIRQLEHLLAAWESGSTASLTSVSLPQDALLLYRGHEGPGMPIQVVGDRLPRWWSPGFVLCIGLMIALGGGWLLTAQSATVSTGTRWLKLALGWLAGWGVAVLGFPLFGLGFLAGAAVTDQYWARQGLGGASWGRWLGLVGLWLLLSALALPLLLTQSLLS
ncbi:MAG: hypothetical protein GEEBNDBF_01114 [bacterium]|nr:hypothetical protein [bacterium]